MRRRLLMVGVLVAVLNFGGLSVLYAMRSADGKAARMTQCAREPVFRKLVVAGRHYGLLDRGDVAVFLRTSPQGCPPRP